MRGPYGVSPGADWVTRSGFPFRPAPDGGRVVVSAPGRTHPEGTGGEEWLVIAPAGAKRPARPPFPIT